MVDTAGAPRYNGCVPGKRPGAKPPNQNLKIWVKGRRKSYETQVCDRFRSGRRHGAEPGRLRQHRFHRERCYREHLTEAASTSEAASEEAPAEETAAGDFDLDQDITVISREDGSGTRGAFIELTGVEDDNGDNTTRPPPSRAAPTA